MKDRAFNLSGPDSGLEPYSYISFLVTADQTDHVAAVVSYNPGEGEYGPPALASYAVDSKGNHHAWVKLQGNFGIKVKRP